jgi:hypothetical protein
MFLHYNSFDYPVFQKYKRLNPLTIKNLTCHSLSDMIPPVYLGLIIKSIGFLANNIFTHIL